MSQTALAEGIGLTFQQVQKYEKGSNRIGASRLQHIANVLKVPIPFFFEGAPGQPIAAGAPSPDYVTEFLDASDGHSIIKAFIKIRNAKVRRAIVALAGTIAGDE
jgi:transcriptional regulator with XRE-family HTH domain